MAAFSRSPVCCASSMVCCHRALAFRSCPDRARTRAWLCDIQVSARAIDFAFHPDFVVHEKRKVVTVDQKKRELQIALCCPPQCSCGFREAAKAKIELHEIAVNRREVGIHSKSALGCLESALVVPRASRAPTTQQTKRQ